MGFNKGIYGITGCSIMLQMAEKLLQARVGSYSRKRKRSSFWSKSYNNMLVSVMFLSQECNANPKAPLKSSYLSCRLLISKLKAVLLRGFA